MAERYGNGNGQRNGNGHEKIIYRLGQMNTGYARLAQFWTALAVTVIGGIVIAQYTEYASRASTIEQMVEVDRGRIGVIEEKQNRHDVQINDLDTRISKDNDAENDRINKVNDDVVHLRERVVCVEHHSPCAEKVPD